MESHGSIYGLLFQNNVHSVETRRRRRKMSGTQAFLPAFHMCNISFLWWRSQRLASQSVALPTLLRVDVHRFHDSRLTAVEMEILLEYTLLVFGDTEQTAFAQERHAE